MDDMPKQCAAIHARMEAQDLLVPWRELTASLIRRKMQAIPAQKLAEEMMQGNLLNAEGDRVSGEVSWSWVLENLSQATAEGGPDLLATAPSHQAFATVVLARTDPDFAKDLLKMDLKITRQRMERQNTRRFEDDGSDNLDLIAKCQAGLRKAEAAA